MANTLGQMIVKIVGDNSEFDQSIDKSQKKLDAFSAATGKVGKSLSLFVTAPLIAAGVAAVKSAGSMEAYQTSFEVMLGSADKAKKMLEDMRKFAAQTPFTFPDLANASKTLLQFGINGDDVMGIMKNLGDVAQGNGDRFRSLALVFGQIQSTGRLMGQDLLQLINAGFNPLQEISRTTGRSMSDLKAAMEKGAISAQDVTNAFKSATSQGGLFYDGMKKASETLPGLWSTLTDSVAEAGRSLAQVLLPTIKSLIQTVTSITDRFATWDDGTKKLVLTIAAVAAGIGPVLIGVSKLTSAISILNAKALWGPLGIVAGVAALAAGLAILIPRIVNAKVAHNEYKEMEDATTASTVAATGAILAENQARASNNLMLANQTLAQKQLMLVQAQAQGPANIIAIRQWEKAVMEAGIDVEKYQKQTDDANAAMLKFAKTLGDTNNPLGQVKKSWQDYYNQTEKAINAQFTEIDKTAELNKGLGVTYDANAEKQKVLKKAIEDLLKVPTEQINEPFALNDRTIQGLIAQYKSLGGALESIKTKYDEVDVAVSDQVKYSRNWRDEDAATQKQMADSYQARIDAEKAAEAAYSQYLAAETEKRKSTYQSWAMFVGDQIGGVMEALGAALAGQEDGWKNLGKVAVHAIAQVIRAIAAQLTAQAATATVAALMGDLSKIPAAVTAGAEAAAAYVTAGVVDALAEKLATGGIVLPTPGGTLAQIGEGGKPEAVVPLDQLDRVLASYGGSSSGGDQQFLVQVRLGDELIYERMHKATRDRRLLIDAGAVVT